MAQIKKIVKPGDLIRGAKVGVAGLDKDGNVIGTGIDTEDIATFPEGAQSGDVLAWGGETGAVWRPHYPENGSEGDVLTLGETGPEWATPALPSVSLYMHVVQMLRGSADGAVAAMIITDSNVPFTSDTLIAYLRNHGFTAIGIDDNRKFYPATGTANISNVICPVIGIYSRTASSVDAVVVSGGNITNYGLGSVLDIVSQL